MKSKNTGEKNQAVTDSKVTSRICHLYGLMHASAKKTLAYAIELGGTLEGEKKRLGHGLWEKWVKDNLPFTSRMASKYIKIWKNGDKFKTELGSADSEMTLTKALRMLTAPDNAKRDINRGEDKKRREDYANGEHDFDNASGFMDEILAGDNAVMLPQMVLKAGRKVTLIVTSPPYNNNRPYGALVDDNQPYEDYLDGLLKLFIYYAKLLRVGGRVIYNVPSFVTNKRRDEAGQPYNHFVVDDLSRRVEELGLGFRCFDRIIWYKPSSNCCGNNKSGTADPTMPVMQSRCEYVIVWAYKQFDLPNINNVDPDITEDEYKDWSTNVWQIAPYVGKKNPNPSAFPERLVERILKIYSRPGDWILDPYCGSGTTPKVCKDLGRHFTGIDIQKGQCKFAKARISA